MTCPNRGLTAFTRELPEGRSSKSMIPIGGLQEEAGQHSEAGLACGEGRTGSGTAPVRNIVCRWRGDPTRRPRHPAEPDS